VAVDIDRAVRPGVEPDAAMSEGASESFESVPPDDEGVRRHLKRRLALFLPR
jgi:hypothetical protein